MDLLQDGNRNYDEVDEICGFYINFQLGTLWLFWWFGMPCFIIIIILYIYIYLCCLFLHISIAKHICMYVFVFFIYVCIHHTHTDICAEVLYWAQQDCDFCTALEIVWFLCKPLANGNSFSSLSFDVFTRLSKSFVRRMQWYAYWRRFSDLF